MTASKSFQTILNNFRHDSFSEKEKGTKFERLMQAYLQTDPRFAPLFARVWLWNDFPSKKDFGGKDTGIDLVAKTVGGDYWAIQCKCFAEDALIDKPAVDSFISTSSKKFTSDDLTTASFAHRLWISTTNKWGANAEESIRNQNPPVSRISLYELENAAVDWEKLEKGLHGDNARISKKSPFPHQLTAIQAANTHYKVNSRGKLIMACGTGKTFTSLKIAENETNGQGFVLFLVPSIALLGQTLREWAQEACESINAVCVCSDSGVSQKRVQNEDADGYSVVDLALPASTSVKQIAHQLNYIRDKKKSGMTVVFSTYQSIDVIAKAQSALIKSDSSKDKSSAIFDLIICDEAHRTTGVTLADEDSSDFVKVHDDKCLRAKKRMYMTATPRLYSDDSKARAKEADAVLCSMDDASIYGEEFYRIGFGEAVEKDLLSDYKVLILTVTENDMPSAIQKMVSDSNSEINTDDASKLIGVINALSKRILGDAGVIAETDPEPMRRAVGFCQNIKVSKKITGALNSTSSVYYESLTEESRQKLVSIVSDHIDGTMSAPFRDEKLGWLKSAGENTRECRILTNVRCLSEGVDVPSLDSVLFLSARNSQIDVVQSVGRVMRKAPNKRYGYIIIPVVVPVDIAPEKALDDNERYKIVWTVLNALRAHDDRFNAIINKIDLNKNKPHQIIIGRIGGDDSNGKTDGKTKRIPEITRQLVLQFEKLQNVILARLVIKVGDRRYWEQWANDVARIAERYTERINRLVQEGGEHKKAFESFLNGLQKNINPSITEIEAVEMLAQHIITKPVFEALFEGYSFVKNNPISVSMQRMLDLLEAQSLEKDAETLQKFYESVKMRAGGIDNAEGRQRIIVELYDKFFKTAFPKMVEKLGIVYTPVEVVDFIIHSVEGILQKEFGRSISDKNIHILDPFTGTGTFITRLLQSGLINPKDLARKYDKEIHANEIVLLAYYIAAINIENAYHDAMKEEKTFQPFNGICLTDTFQLGEMDASEQLFKDMFPQNSARVEAQKQASLRVIMGNPPYSVGQKSANDNAQNQSYPMLDAKIASTYVSESAAGLNKSLYDAYIKAFRWSTDRLDPQNGGVIAFVSNGGWLDGNSTDGFRKCLEKEFTAIYVFNLRGNQRTSGELSRKEGGKIFGSGSRTPIAITILVKNPNIKTKHAAIRYYDIGDYHSREEKLYIINNLKSVVGDNIAWETLTPNSHGDWISQRNNAFGTYIPIEPPKKFNIKSPSYFITYSLGASTNRDAWVYNFSTKALTENMRQTIKFYNNQLRSFMEESESNHNLTVDDFISTDSSKISWTVNLKKDLEKNRSHRFDATEIITGIYRPFCKQKLYFQDAFIERPGINKQLFPNATIENRIICVSATNEGVSALMANCIPNLHFNGDSQCFPLNYFAICENDNPTMFDDAEHNNNYIRRDAISEFILHNARIAYGNKVGKEDIFHYVYGILHSFEYRTQFAADLKKMLPRIPLVDESKDFWAFSKAGRKLSDLHVNYETVPPADNVIVTGAKKGAYKVEKMRFPNKNDKSKIIYNSQITIDKIPAEAYEYIVNGKSAIEWIMERYQFTTHKESGIKNDPNDWANEVGNPRYILDLLLSIIRVSVETVKIVKALPKLNLK